MTGVTDATGRGVTGAMGATEVLSLRCPRFKTEASVLGRDSSVMSDSVLGVIPVRGGSKRIPRKNLKQVGGKPLVAHAVEQAEEAATLDEVVVSTDDDEIRQVAREYGGNAPFERPAELATDTAPSAAAVEHALSWFEDERDETFGTVAKIQATTPRRTAADIDGAIERLRDADADSVCSVAEWQTPPTWAVCEGDEGLESFFAESSLWTDDRIPRSQDVPTLYYPNGAVFAANREAFRDAEGFYTEHTVGYEMPPERSIDVDEPFDLRLVRALAEYENRAENGSEGR